MADHITVSGEVAGTWSADTVQVAGDINIPDGEVLQINPGTVVQFLGSFEFSVEGSIDATGSQNDSIYFMIADTSGFHNDSVQDGGWKGIRFAHVRQSNETSVFSYCRFAFGKNINEDLLSGNGGAMSVRDYDKVIIDRCCFADNYAIYNGGAVALDSADISITNSLFIRNRSGLTIAPWGYGGAVCSDNSSPEIRWNIFSGNSSTGVGGGLSVRYKDCNVYNNIFTGNVSGLGGGICVLHIPEISHRVNNNLVAGNTAVYFGGGVATMDANPVYINNTIAYNTATYGGGFYCKDSISPDFYNTIFWGNTAAVGPTGYLFEVYSQADFFNCVVEGGPVLFGGSGGGEAFFGAYEQCIEMDPEFKGDGEYPYELSWDSPCYDAGAGDTTGFMLPEYDLAGNPRLSHSAVDMGAYEIVWIGVGENPQLDEQVRIWPNPTTGKFQVPNSKFQIYSGSNNIKKQIEVLDLNGKVVLSLDNLGTGDQIEIDISHLPPGIYMVRISTGNSIITKKLLKVSR
jgi:predicted outer membrane repeat protein